MMQISYNFHKKKWRKEFNEQIDNFKRLFLPNTFVRYLEVYDIVNDRMERRFDILCIEMMPLPQGTKGWQKKVSELKKLKRNAPAA